ncbi:hypothetical protein IPL68_02655 [Candidatus Saccharibacteria bacterium]|nr:MAG: hypothetical protein IPL68_02655 [Candidatus Saccharibacteria bacterium]
MVHINVFQICVIGPNHLLAQDFSCKGGSDEIISALGVDYINVLPQKEYNVPQGHKKLPENVERE